MKTEIRNLDDKGRCCGKKPLVYKRDHQKFCCRCDRAFDIDTGAQVENWAWIKMASGGFARNARFLSKAQTPAA